MRPSLRASVRFVYPAASEVAYGATRVRVSVSPPSGTIVRLVEFFVDGRKAGSDRVPPYEVLWHAGEKMASHTFRAVALFSDGTRAEDARTTRGLVMTEYELVEGEAIEHAALLVSVVDKLGFPVKDLQREDFRVRDRGEPVEIDAFSPLSEQRNLPLSITVLVDRSGSMLHKEEEWQKASVGLLQVLRSIDQVRVSSFAVETAIIQDFTRDATSFAESITKVGPPGGGTHLYRAVFETVRDMRDLPGRKAIFVITDGIDTDLGSFAGLRGDWRSSLLGSIEKLASRSGVTVITILTQPTIRTLLPIQSLSMRTGGWWTYPTSDLTTLLRRIGERLLGAYLLEYDVASTRSPERKRRVSVSLNRENTGWKLFTTEGRFGRQTPVEALKDDLKSGSVAQRRRAVLELQKLGVDGTDALLEKALDDAAPEVRIAALGAVAGGGGPAALEQVMRQVHDDDPGVREAAFQAAVRFGSDALPALSKIASRSGRERRAALRAVGFIGDPQALPLLEKALAESDCRTRAAAADGAGVLFELAGGSFTDGEAGAEGGGDLALDLLRRALDDACVEAADAAALALGRLAHQDALPRLIGIAANTTETHRRGETLLILSSYLTPGTFQALERRLVSRGSISPESRQAAAVLFAAAVRTARWLATEDGLARVVDLGVVEARTVLSELQRLGEATQAAPTWRDPIEAVLLELSDIERRGGVR